MTTHIHICVFFENLETRTFSFQSPQPFLPLVYAQISTKAKRQQSLGTTVHLSMTIIISIKLRVTVANRQSGDDFSHVPALSIRVPLRLEFLIGHST